ncbi:SDR family NAD(P)-dependent oxidoreductase [Aquabacterium sp. A08]|uniref:SDR family NAD(P)-dependent oxidoreductase n=1 Tax=Aquabacterium sp. A08 TaxID=2718532 RepID=UPI00141DE5E9|nr:SDR family NAD(P)-dependent oxidoreductase [Aquabacterium sp. A08]NIC42812.1 SDR family NAD(P)-dependent oxidoreductase [Aquabacterium sp. A08]
MTPAQHLTIVTGSSRGLGRALAEQLLSPQRVLLCLARRPCDDLAHQAMQAGAHLEQWSQDLTDTAEAAERLARWLHSLHAPGLDSATLINNAGVIPAIGPLNDCPPDELARALRVGLEAPMALTGAFLRATQAWVDAGWQGTRKVLNISSGLGRRAMAGQAPYCAAKAGLDHFSRCTALDEARRPRGARIASLAPGVIDTDMQTQLRAGDPARFPDHARFVGLKTEGLLATPAQAARQVLSHLDRPDFGDPVVADVRD